MEKLLTKDDIQYVRCWVNCYKVNETFTFEGWKKEHVHDKNAPVANKIGKQVVVALDDPADSRLDFIAFTEGPSLDGKIGCRSSGNMRYYKRLK